MYAAFYKNVQLIQLSRGIYIREDTFFIGLINTLTSKGYNEIDKIM